jgi:superfamily II DNA or RNA helicase
MARHLVNDANVRPLVQDLVRLVLHEGSVNAAQQRLVSTLAHDKTEGWLYPNRLHTLLSEERSRAVNTETLDVLRRAMSRLPGEALSPDAARSAKLRSDVLHAWETLWPDTPNGESPSLHTIAARINLPPAVVRRVLEDSGVTGTAPLTGASGQPATDKPGFAQPDWSFQDTAYARCLEALTRDPNRKVGLVLPTGGGKTRVAMRIAVSMLDRSEHEDSILLWVTHRTRLKTQARRELQLAITQGTRDLPDDAVALLADRMEFCMLSDLRDRLAEFQDRIELVIVDEAHHAAASSYQPIFDYRPLRGLFLTATPNRTDLLPIGIDEVAYTITSRELFDRGVIVEPKLETLTLEDFAWDNADERRNLADILLDRAQTDFVKTLVAVSRIDYTEALHEALLEVLDGYETHVLDIEDIGFVHGSGTSTGDPSDVFLDEFAARPRGLLVATAQLLGEGFDDPSINTVVVTFPTASMVQLMQVAGRSLRSAPDKRSVYVLQVKDSPLAYHWEQRWLYQDISDLLRPQLVDNDYSTFDGLTNQVEHILVRANVPRPAVRSVREALADVEPGEYVSLLLTGLPYDGPADRFRDDAQWNALLVSPRDRRLFLRVFNDFSGRGADVSDFADFLRNYLPPDPDSSSRWKRYVDMLYAMSYARREIDGHDYDGAGYRQFVPAIGTTWLQYISFRYEPAVPIELERFLGDAVNGAEIIARYTASPDSHALAIKIPLPLAGTLAFLADDSQRDWLVDQRNLLRGQLNELEAMRSFGVIAEWSRALQSAPLPLVLIERFDRLLREEDFATLTLLLPDCLEP